MQTNYITEMYNIVQLDQFYKMTTIKDLLSKFKLYQSKVKNINMSNLRNKVFFWHTVVTKLNRWQTSHTMIFQWAFTFKMPRNKTEATHIVTKRKCLCWRPIVNTVFLWCFENCCLKCWKEKRAISKNSIRCFGLFSQKLTWSSL